MATNLKEHYCSSMPRMASISFNKKLRYDDKRVPELFTSGFELMLVQRKKEGKLIPKTYDIKVPIDYCPFCNEKLEPKSHLESCDCTLCSVQKSFRGEQTTTGE